MLCFCRGEVLFTGPGCCSVRALLRCIKSSSLLYKIKNQNFFLLSFPFPSFLSLYVFFSFFSCFSHKMILRSESSGFSFAKGFSLLASS